MKKIPIISKGYAAQIQIKLKLFAFLNKVLFLKQLLYIMCYKKDSHTKQKCFFFNLLRKAAKKVFFSD